MPVEIVHRAESAAAHAVDVKAAGKMIDLMLQDACVPAARLNDFFLAALIHAFDADGPSPRHKRGKPGQAEAAFEKGNGWVRRMQDARIHNHMEGNWLSFAFGEYVRRGVLQKLFAILDYRKLNRQADLRRREADAGRVMHRFAHIQDQALRLFADDLFGCERARSLAQHRLAHLYDFQLHNALLLPLLLSGVRDRPPSKVGLGRVELP